MSPWVLPGPIMPQPTMPTTIRSEGAARPSLPSALAGIRVGAAMAAAAAPIKRRREILEVGGFIATGIMTDRFSECEWKNFSNHPPVGDVRGLADGRMRSAMIAQRRRLP